MLDGHEDEEGIADESYGEAIVAALGMDRRNEVLARLYIIRWGRDAAVGGTVPPLHAHTRTRTRSPPHTHTQAHTDTSPQPPPAA